MIIEETVMIDDEELKEAILDYINKHKKSSYTTLKIWLKLMEVLNIHCV